MNSRVQRILPLFLALFATEDHAAAEKLAYRLVPGQTFAYDVSVAWSQSGRQQRLTGQPVYQVRYKDGSYYMMMVIGRLRYEAIEQGQWVADPSGDYWFGTTLKINSRATKCDAMPGSGGRACPTHFGGHACDLVFPDLPPHDNSKLSEGGTTRLLSVPLSPFARPSGGPKKGRYETGTVAHPLGNGKVQLNIGRQHVTDGLTSQTYYRSQATHDRRLGTLSRNIIVISHFGGGNDWSVVMHAKRITDSEQLAAVAEQASRTYQQLPTGMVPIRLTRQWLDLQLPTRYSVKQPPAAGAMVGYFDKKGYEYFAAQVIESVGKHIKIRLVGSGEEFTVPPGRLAVLNRAAFGR